LLGALAALSLTAVPVPAAPSRIRLPSPRDLLSPSAVILIPRSGETETSKLPGPVADDETVRVGLGPDGAVSGIVVDQTLTIHGTGDFDLVMPGPATHIVGPPDQATQPGLRRGEILWNGFSPGLKTLRSTVTLDPTFEQFRIPLAVSVRFRRGGRTVKPPVTGPVEIEIRISNTTARLIQTPDAASAPNELAGLLDALHREVSRRRRPVAGRRGVPSSLTATSSVATRTESVQIPMVAGGIIAFPSGRLTGARVDGASLDAGPGAPAVRFSLLLPSALQTTGTHLIRLRGTAEALGAPRFDIRAVAATTDPALLAPPNGETWQHALSGLDPRGLRETLVRAETAMWQALLLPQLDAYLGNPGTGPSQTVYEITSASAAPPPVRVRPARLHAGGLALALAAAALAIGNAALLWSKS
jgi:hypothetical protein